MVDDKQARTGSWHARAVQAGLVRVAISALPVATSVTVSLVAGRVVPRPGGLLMLVWWIALAGLSTATLVTTDRLARRFLPLAALLQLTLAFPDKAPSRFSIAMRSGNVAKVEKEVAAATRDGLPVNLNDAVVAALTMVTALNHHDRGTRGHSERVRAYAEMLCDELGVSGEQRDRLRWGALLHDIGKLTVPAEILNKPGKPDASQWAVLSRHPLEGERILAPLVNWLGDAVHCAGQHHERWDGKGYPRGLRSSEISWAARIVAVADSFAVMTAARSYKAPMSTDAARSELARCAGSQFDPIVVRAMMNLSLGRIRTVMGPIASLANLSCFANAAAAGGGAATTAATATATMGFIIAANMAPIPVVHDFAAPPAALQMQARSEPPADGTTVVVAANNQSGEVAPAPSAGFVVATLPVSVPTAPTVAPTTTTVASHLAAASGDSAPATAAGGVSFITSPPVSTDPTLPIGAPQAPPQPEEGAASGEPTGQAAPTPTSASASASTSTTKPTTTTTTTTRPTTTTTTTRPTTTTTKPTTTTTSPSTTTTEGVVDNVADSAATTSTTVAGPPPSLTIGDPSLGGWQLNGSAALVDSRLRLTPNETYKRGSAFWPTAVPTTGLEISFTFLTSPNDNGADGVAVVFADTTNPATALGANGGGLGFAGIAGSAITFDTYDNWRGNDPNGNFVGWVSTQPAQDWMTYLATSTNVPDLDRTERHVVIRVTGSEIIVVLDNIERLRIPTTLAPEVLIGFSAGTGGLTNAQSVSNVRITVP